MLEGTGERYLPWLEDPITNYEHLHRYAYAAQFIENKRVLDLACGEGYGSYKLSQRAKSVVGIDIHEAAISHAIGKYVNRNLQFKVGSVTDVPIEGEHIFDVIVCYEAIEHIEDYEKCLNEVKRLLIPGGIFIVSTPDKKVYSDEPQFQNPYHVHEFYFHEFQTLLEKYFKSLHFLGQSIFSGSQIWPLSLKDNTGYIEFSISRTSKEFRFVDADQKVPKYFIVLASDGDNELDLKTSTLLDVTNELAAQSDRFRKDTKAQRLQLAALKEELDRLRAKDDSGWLGQWKRMKSKLFSAF